MLIQSLLLFLAAMAGGAIGLYTKKLDSIPLGEPLVFSGAYIFSITVTHIIPEAYQHTENYLLTGSLVLVGFYMQLILAFFSRGLEHGHTHTHLSGKPYNGFLLVLALVFHSLIEGTILGHPHSHSHEEHRVHGILMGIILHKIPAAYVLALIFKPTQTKSVLWVILTLFALASPIGVWLPLLLGEVQILKGMSQTVLFALVAGNFLHISTSIFFESNPTHRFGMRRLTVSLLGAMLAIFTEWF